MATHYGGGSLTLAGGAVGQVQSAEVSYAMETADAQAIGDRWAVPVQTKGSWSGSADVVFDHVTGLSTLLATYLIGSSPTRAAVTCTVVLASTTNGGTLAGSVVLTGFTPKTSTQDIVKGTLTFVGSGAPTAIA